MTIVRHPVVAFLLGAFSMLSQPVHAQLPLYVPESNYGGATPTNARAWFTFQDYPEAAVRDNVQGYVVVSFIIDTDGRVGDCSIKQSSSSPILDAVPCQLMKKRARFIPAKDIAGQPKATTGFTTFSFWMP